MAAKKRYAIPDKVANIALKYGGNVSKGIQAMEKLLIEYDNHEITSFDRDTGIVIAQVSSRYKENE